MEYAAAEKFLLEVNDRVVVIHEGKLAKGYVANVIADVVVDVAFERDGGDTVTYPRDEVMALYRPVPGGIVPIIALASRAQL